MAGLSRSHVCGLMRRRHSGFGRVGKHCAYHIIEVGEEALAGIAGEKPQAARRQRQLTRDAARALNRDRARAEEEAYRDTSNKSGRHAQ